MSVTGYHPELWQPAWSSTLDVRMCVCVCFKFCVCIYCVVRTILLALRDHMRVDDGAAIGYLDYSEEVRRSLAKKSLKWKCLACCGGNDLVGKVDGSSSSVECKEENSPILRIQRGQQRRSQLTGLTMFLAFLAVLFSYIYYNQ